MGHKICPLCPKGQCGRYYYKIPYDNKETLDLWEKSLGIKLDRSYYTHVCCRHFDDSDYTESYLHIRGSVANAGRPKIKETAIPHVNLPSLGHATTTFACNSTHPPRKIVVRKVNRLAKLVQEKKKLIGDSSTLGQLLFPEPAGRKSKLEGPKKKQLVVNATHTQTSAFVEGSATFESAVASPTNCAILQKVQCDGLVYPIFRTNPATKNPPAPQSTRVLKIAPKLSVQDKSKVIILEAPKQKLVIQLYSKILPRPSSAPPSTFFEPQIDQPYLPVATTGISTTVNSFLTSTASSTTATTTTSATTPFQVTGVVPKTVLEKQMLQRAMEVAAEWNISPSKFVTPVKKIALATSTPMSALETIAENLDDSLIVQSKRKLSFNGDNDCDSSPDKSTNFIEQSFSDPSWKPSSSNIIDYDMSYAEEEDELPEVSSENNDCNQELLLVSANKILELLQRCTMCNARNSVERKQTGAYCNYKCICKKGHIFNWATSDIYKKKPLINLKVAGAMLLTGQNFASVTRLAKLMNLRLFNKDTYYGIIDHYAKPVICTRWAQDREERLNKIRDSQVPCNIGGDARFDSRGKAGAKFGIYTMMNAENDEILDFVVMQKGLEPGELESKGFMIAMSRLVKHIGPDQIAAFCSDRNYTVGKRMKDHFPTIYHSFDVWHVSKGLNKNLAALAKKNPNIASWTRSISNHVWFCAANCNQSETEMIRLWESLFRHLQDEHAWVDPDGTPRSCGHGALTADERTWKNWLDASEIRQLKNVLLKTRVVNQLKKCSRFLHTGCIESFHSLCLMYASKETQFSYSGMILRNILAVLDHNANTGRSQVGSKWVYSNAKKTMVEKSTYEAKSDKWKSQLLADIIKFATTEPELIEFDPHVEELLYPFHLPTNMTGLERPTREQLVAARRNRSRSQ